MDPTFFASRDEFRAWLDKHHAASTELVVGILKVGVMPGSMTLSEAVEEALCYGWIDGRGSRIDDRSYGVRFTPRRPGSIWSAVNLNRIEQLTARGLMQPAGLAVFAARKPEQTKRYASENEPQDLDPEQEERFRRHAAAWDFFQAQPASYRRAVIWWVVSAKQASTRERRLDRLIDDSARGQRMPQFSPPRKKATDKPELG